jgi:hypothetical protein
MRASRAFALTFQFGTNKSQETVSPRFVEQGFSLNACKCQLARYLVV